MENQSRFTYLSFVKISLLISVFSLGLYIYFDFKKDNEFPYLIKDDSLNDKVISIEKNRGIARVTLSGGKKFTLGWALNHNYNVNSLVELINEDDHIRKSKYSDTIILKHRERDYLFVLNKTIED